MIRLGLPIGILVQFKCWLDRRRALRRGWRLDDDLWWVRDRRLEDVSIPGAGGFDHFGFTKCGKVYVRTPAQALLYDEGLAIEWLGPGTEERRVWL